MLASPRLAPPSHAAPRLAAPGPAQGIHGGTARTFPPARTVFPRLAMPRPAQPGHAKPRHAAPRRASPGPAQPRHAQGNISVGDLHPVAGVNLPDSDKRLISKSLPLFYNAFLAVSINSLLRVLARRMSFRSYPACACSSCVPACPHRVSSPCLALPRQALPCPAVPCRARPRLAQGNISVGDLHPVAGVNLPDSP